MEVWALEEFSVAHILVEEKKKVINIYGMFAQRVKFICIKDMTNSLKKIIISVIFLFYPSWLFPSNKMNMHIP